MRCPLPPPHPPAKDATPTRLTLAQEKAVPALLLTIFPSLCYFTLLRFFCVRGAGAPPRHRPGGLPRRRLLWPAVALSNFCSRPLEVR